MKRNASLSLLNTKHTYNIPILSSCFGMALIFLGLEVAQLYLSHAEISFINNSILQFTVVGNCLDLIHQTRIRYVAVYLTDRYTGKKQDDLVRRVYRLMFDNQT